MNDLLDDAALALRDETTSGPEVAPDTLARVLCTLASEGSEPTFARAREEDLVDAAALALRDETSEEGETDTLERIQRALSFGADADLELSASRSREEEDASVGELDLVGAAAAALRDETARDATDGAATLAAVRARLESDRLERAAYELARDTAVPGEGARLTAERVTATLRSRTRARWAAAAAVLLAALVGAPTTWAWSTGRLERWIEVITGASEEPAIEHRAPEPRPARPASSARRAPAITERAPEPAPEPIAEPAPEPSVLPIVNEPIASEPVASAPLAIAPRDRAIAPARAPRRAPRAVEAAPSRPAPATTLEPARSGEPPTASAPSRSDEPPTASAPARADEPAAADRPIQQAGAEPARPSAERPDPAPSADEARERELFQSAHRLQPRGTAETLAAWDAYLAAYPRGRYAPEARYNRAITLIRLGRLAEARRALEPFANAPEGAYRRAEARALLDALERR